MNKKLVAALIASLIGTAANATCWLTPQGCGSTSSSSSNGGNSSATASSVGGNANATGGQGGHGGKATSNSSVNNSGNSTNRVSNAQKQGQSQNQVATGGNAAGGAGGYATGGQGVGSQGQSVSVDSHVEAAKRAAASAYAAPLTSSNDTCMGSSSGAVQAPGLGISVGSTWTDKNCVMLKNARELWNMGLKEAALARLCMDPDNKDAIELSGVTCPTKKQSAETSGPSLTQSSTSSGSSIYSGNDNIVRARLGLPLVKESN